MNHTPGPWTYNTRLAEDGDKETGVYGESTYLCEPVCLIPHDDITEEGYKEVQANAHLIAAAPELLEALKGYNLIDYTVLIGDALILNTDPRVAKILEQLAAEIQQVRPTATAAISKAEGKG